MWQRVGPSTLKESVPAHSQTIKTTKRIDSEYREQVESMGEHSAGQSLSKRLREAGLDEQRFIPVKYEDGDKRPTENRWQSRLYPAELLNGSMGVVCGDGLVVIDLDDYKSGVTTPEQLEELPETFTVRTMHGGEHRYFRVVDEQPRSQKRPWGDVQSAGKMVVAPGSEFIHAECNDCDQSGMGRYTVLKNVPIATVNPKEHPETFGVQTDVKSENSTFEDENPTPDVDDRLTRAVKQDEKFARLWQWANQGDSLSAHRLTYRAEDGGDDRSTAESVLLYKLLLWLRDERKAHQTMNSVSPPKWGSRGENYKKSIIASAKDLLAKNDYDPEQASSGSGGVRRDTAIQVVTHGVLDALLHQPIGRFKTTDVVDNEDVSVAEDQVGKVLDGLEETGHLKYERSGREGWWVAEGYRSGDWEVPAAGDEFYKQFWTKDEVSQQRASWLENHPEN